MYQRVASKVQLVFFYINLYRIIVHVIVQGSCHDLIGLEFIFVNESAHKLVKYIITRIYECSSSAVLQQYLIVLRLIKYGFSNY